MVVHDNLRRALRAVALFEAAKGFLVLFAGLAVFSLLHQNIQAAAEQLVEQMHFNPAHHFPKIFIEAAAHLTDHRILLLALLAFSYSIIRFVEAYGLWFARRWAEWFALISGGLYLPIELYELAKGFSWLKIGLVLINTLVVFSMALALKRNRIENRRIIQESKP